MTVFACVLASCPDRSQGADLFPVVCDSYDETGPRPGDVLHEAAQRQDGHQERTRRAQPLHRRFRRMLRDAHGTVQRSVPYELIVAELRRS